MKLDCLLFGHDYRQKPMGGNIYIAATYLRVCSRCGHLPKKKSA